MENALERLAQAGCVWTCVRHGVVCACVDQRLFAAQDGAHDFHVLAGLTQRFAIRLAVPALHDLRTGQPQPQQQSSVGELVQSHGGHGGVGRRAAGHLHDGCAQMNVLSERAQPGQRRDGVRTVGLGGPYRIVTQPVGLLYEFDRQTNLST